MIDTEHQAREFVRQICDDRAMERLDRLAAMLVEANSQQNLVSSASLGSLWRRHIADSAQLLDLGPEPFSGTLMDLGSGAGFPGVVLAAMRPESEIRLVESRRLRVDWLKHCVGVLGLPHCSIEGRRVEALPDTKVSVICARAFAPLPKLIAIAQRFSTADTVWLLPKGRSAAQEVADLPAALRRMFHVEQSITDSEAGIVVGRISEATGR